MTDERNLEGDGNNQTKMEPVDIAQAFKMVNEANRSVAQEPVDNPEDNGNTGADDGIGEPGAAEASDGGTEEPLPAGDNGLPDTGDGGGSGESPALVEPIDYSPAKQEILKNIQNNAVQLVQKEMKEQGIELWTMNDIYEKDENTGRVTFKNPDDPNHPFEDRTKAQAWINSINEDIQNHFRRQVNIKQQELVQQAAPMLQTIDFAPQYEAMSEQEKAVFDDLVEPYAITDGSGNVIGFNTNLAAVANVAKRIAGKFNAPAPAPQSQTTEPAAKPPASTPSLDMPTGNGSAELDDEPKTIGEALKRIDQQNRKGNEKKGK